VIEFDDEITETTLFDEFQGLLRIPSNLRELREELFEGGEMSELTCFKPEPRASPISQTAR
jgi:hypothetical protein